MGARHCAEATQVIKTQLLSLGETRVYRTDKPTDREISQYTQVQLSALVHTHKCNTGAIDRCKGMDLFRMQWATKREASIRMSWGKASGRASQRRRLLSGSLEYRASIW